jgi:ceramide glucosyltransferase
VIDHVVLNRTFANSWAHQVRWMKSTRYSRPKGHFGSGLTFAVPFGIVGLVGGLLAGYPLLGWAMFAWSLANRVIQSVAIGWGIVRDPRALKFCWLYPVRDLLGFFLWTASYSGNVIEWRGEKYRLEFGGKMRKVA